MARLLYAAVLCISLVPAYAAPAKRADHRVLILGGGVTGVIAARTLHENGIDDFLIIEARDELGGRLYGHNFTGINVEVGANWVQGTQIGDGPANPVYLLAEKHNVTLASNNWDDIGFHDETGHTDFLEALNAAGEAYQSLVNAAGARISNKQVDLTSRSGFSLTGWKPKDHHARAAEYYHFDWEYAQTPEQTSWIASSNNNNYTFSPEDGGFSDENLMSVDQRGFKYMLQAEAEEFLEPSQVLLSSTITNVAYGPEGVAVTLAGGQIITGDLALCTFSVGVLQNDDVTFDPVLPSWKQEAIDTQTMGTYTKIFMKFPNKFWDDTEMVLYADPNKRGYYPVWQSLDHEGFFVDSHLYFVTVTGDESERIETLTNEEVQAEIMGVLRRMYPDRTVPEPTDFYFQRWHSDPLYRGSFANWPGSFHKEHQDNLRAPVDTLYFAGEATSYKYFGYLQGAYTEGEDVAQAIADCILNNNCQPQIPGADVTYCNRDIPN